MTHDEALINDRDRAAHKLAQSVGLYLHALRAKKSMNPGSDEYFEWSGACEHHLQVVRHLEQKYQAIDHSAQVEATA